MTREALREAVATLVPSRLPEMFKEMQQAFDWAADQGSTEPIRRFLIHWGSIVAIERDPAKARRLHDAERRINDPDPAVRQAAVREAGEIVRDARQEVAGG
ncbi:hypothetical protein ACFOSC_16575 [Streptantibioticus rubrisoli]|uniref:hypothetical protein n=1 Tax=Streptantibioticus rubrisoli TaxID=1387313 RepID=UPI003556332B